MERTCRLFRILANRQRIRVLRLLAVAGELRLMQIAEAIATSPPRACAHLDRMTGVGLLWRRRSGSAVYYRLAESPADPVVATVLDALRRVFKSVTGRDPRRIAAAEQSSSQTDSDKALFAFFTGFTHPRRLQIVRYLIGHETAAPRTLRGALRMSWPACQRHLAKLRRRGILVRRTQGREATYALRKARGTVQKTVSQAVRNRLTAMTD